MLKNYKLYVMTFGCVHNVSDSDMLISMFLQHGCQIVKSPYQANLVYINSCTVKTPSQEKAIYQTIKWCKMTKTILGGCVPQSMKSDKRLQPFIENKQLILAGVFDRTTINEIMFDLVSNQLKDSYVNKQASKLRSFNPDSFYLSNPTTASIAIQQGCLNSCAYCKTVQSRGRLYSYPAREIISLMDKLIKEHEQLVQIQFTGEDVLAWGLDRGDDFRTFLKQVQKYMDEFSKTNDRKIFIRVGMSNPENIFGKEVDLAKFLNLPYVYKFIHLPVQSGSNKILKLMNRKYTVEQYIDSCQKLYSLVPRLVISTDIIVGFPEETEEDYMKTLDLQTLLKFQIFNVTQYFVRDSTVAARMDQLPELIKKARSNGCHTHGLQQFNRTKYVGEILDVIVDEVDEKEKNNRKYAGKTLNQIQVNIEGEAKLGQVVKCRIISAGRVSLIGQITSRKSNNDQIFN